MLKVEGADLFRLRLPRISRVATAFMLILFVWVFFILSATSAAAGISQGYSTTDTELRQNMVAALGSNSSDTKLVVERASVSNRSKVVGIVTTIDGNLLTLTNTEAKVHITTSGEALTYVTDLNGAIKKGDFISVSPITGVGMKAGGSDNFVIGVALEDFDNQTAESQQVTTTQGSERTVLINRVRLSVEPRELGQSGGKDTPFLTLFGESVTGKSVSQTQVLVALIIFLLLLIVEGSIIYGAIHSTIVSIGRNPLARTALYRQLLQVSWLSLLVLMFGAGSIYAILWL